MFMCVRNLECVGTGEVSLVKALRGLIIASDTCWNVECEDSTCFAYFTDIDIEDHTVIFAYTCCRYGKLRCIVYRERMNLNYGRGKEVKRTCDGRSRYDMA